MLNRQHNFDLVIEQYPILTNQSLPLESLLDEQMYVMMMYHTNEYNDLNIQSGIHFLLSIERTLTSTDETLSII